MPKLLYIVIFLIFAVPLAACKAQHSPQILPPSADAVVAQNDVPEGFPGLEFFEWRLKEIIPPENEPDKVLPPEVSMDHFHILLKKDSIFVQGSCNYMGGGLEYLGRNRLRVFELMMTQKGCDYPYVQADAVVYEAILNTKAFRATEHDGTFHILLSGTEGMQLIFHGSPTLEYKYGEATQRFIELRVHSTPCSEKLCFQWREFRYTEKYDQIPLTDWSTDFPGMEGFTPEVGYNYILRLKEYQTSSGILWVLDLRVKSESQDSESPWKR